MTFLLTLKLLYNATAVLVENLGLGVCMGCRTGQTLGELAGSIFTEENEDCELAVTISSLVSNPIPSTSQSVTFPPSCGVKRLCVILLKANLINCAGPDSLFFAWFELARLG